MVVINMNSMPSKIIENETYLQVRNPFRLSKDHGPKKHLNTWRKEEPNEIKVFVKVEDEVVHHKKYNGHCTKQQIIIPKAT
jgi:hypothetical protein